MSPSSAKPQLVVQDWIAKKLAIEVRSFNPVSIDDICLAHRRQYVQDVFDGGRANGFGNYDKAVAESTLYTVGSICAATQWAIRNNAVACSPTSGFHHASYGGGGAFCTFNGLMVAADMAIEEWGAERVGILDCDWHYGDGTDDIIKSFDKYSDVKHESIGNWGCETGVEYLLKIASRLKSMRDRNLILYQAGADAHIDDPLGGAFTSAQLRERDSMVFQFAKKYKIPLVWNLAGGYQKDKNGQIPKVLSIHRATMKECIKVFG